MAEVNSSNWSSAETRCLIGVWNCDRIRSKMETHKKKEAFGQIAEAMLQEGYNRNAKQVQKKIRDLRYSSRRSGFTTCDAARRSPPQPAATILQCAAAAARSGSYSQYV